MALLNWDDSYSVKITAIDNQHKRFFALINDLYDSMKNGNSHEILQRIIKDLVDYTVYHFGFEEKYFDEFGYPETAFHKKEHKSFVEKVSKFHDDLKKGDAFVSMEIMDFLRKWIKNHIKKTDKLYIEFFHGHGLS